MMWSFVLCVCTILMDGRSLGNSPVNTVAVAGQPILLMCGVQPNKTMNGFTVEWKFQSIGKTGTERLFNGFEISSNKSGLFIRKDIEGEYNLRKNRTELRDGGAYHCLKRIQGQQSQRPETNIAQVTILESDPVCGFNASNGNVIEGDRLRMWCSVNYSGNLHPVMEWSRNDGVIVDSTVSYDKDTFPRTVTSTRYQIMNYSDHGVVYFCKTYFKAPTIDSQREGSSSSPTNAPDYNAECKLTANVLFGPRNLSIAPLEGANYRGDVLYCSASGNPTPTFEWIEVETGYAIQGSNLTLHETMGKGGPTAFLCTAENVVAGEKKTAYTNITIHFSGTAMGLSSETSIPPTLIRWAIRIGPIIIIVMGMIVWKLIKRKCCADSQLPGSEERQASPNEYETSDDLQMSIQPAIDTNQSSTIDH